MKKGFTLLLFVIVAVLVVSMVGCQTTDTTTTPTSTANPIKLNVSAAASLTDALKEINALYTQINPNVTIIPNFAGSGTLQKQIEQGAPADVFISAAAAQMDAIQKGQLILDHSRYNLLNNRVVLIVPNDSTLKITSFNDLVSTQVKQIAIGDPKSVPAGTYAQQAFDKLGITAQIQSKLVLGSDVRQVLTYVESGNVDAGIVYSTDAKTSDKVTVVANAPDDINVKIVYPVAVVKASKNPDAARDYENFLFSYQAEAVFEKYGFSMAGNSSS
jgi:molybdate transport system substrate-binding protein